MAVMSRYIDIRSGILMVVTDLHGEGSVFDRYIETFLALYETGEADRLLLLGDLIHSYGPPDSDHSLRMVQRVMELRQRLGEDRIIMLLGNHEMPHIYGVSLAKGEVEFTPRFEHQLGEERHKVSQFFKTLPFLVRTTGGVMYCHAGPDAESANRAGRLRTFRHDDLIEEAEAMLTQQGNLDQIYEAYQQISGQEYETLAREYLAVSGPADPRYSHLLRALYIQERDHRFATLWDFLFTQNERGLSSTIYEQVCRRYLDAYSIGATTQRVCVSGHVVVREGGFQVVNPYHFRLASATHASPKTEGKYLLIDAQQPIHHAEELARYTMSIF
jgi:hypothetical protein